MKHAIILALLFTSGSVFAGTDVKGSIEKLKTNEDNAKSNFKQYQANVDVSSKNIKEAEEALRQLREQKKKLLMSGGDIDKNRVALDQVQKRLEGYKAHESEEMKKEDVHLAKLQEMVKRLEANKDQRTKNIAEYDSKIADVEKERQNWQSSQQEVGALKKEIEDKETKAVAERDKWVVKKKDYQAEAAKWEKQSHTASEMRAKVEKMQD